MVGLNGQFVSCEIVVDFSVNWVSAAASKLGSHASNVCVELDDLMGRGSRPLLPVLKLYSCPVLFRRNTLSFAVSQH